MSESLTAAVFILSQMFMIIGFEAAVSEKVTDTRQSLPTVRAWIGARRSGTAGTGRADQGSSSR